jgi:hypothetical protein
MNSQPGITKYLKKIHFTEVTKLYMQMEELAAKWSGLVKKAKQDLRINVITVLKDTQDDTAST